MSSPRLNNAIIVGCILIYISVVLFGMDNNTVAPTQYAVLCQVRNSLMQPFHFYFISADEMCLKR